MNSGVRPFDGGFCARLQFVDATTHLALGRTWRGFQPRVVYLREDAVLSRHPAITEGLPVRFGVKLAGFGVKCSKQFGDGAVESRCRVILELGDGVHVSYRAAEAALVLVPPLKRGSFQNYNATQR